MRFRRVKSRERGRVAVKAKVRYTIYQKFNYLPSTIEILDDRFKAGIELNNHLIG